MLKKLFKYEWRSVSTLLFIVHGALLVYALIGRMGYQIYFSKYLSDSSNTVMGITTMFYVTVYVLGDHGGPAHDHALSGDAYTEEFLFR